jgi:hypothetical protein
MVYLNPDALHRMRLDVEGFVRETVGEAASGTPPVRTARRR